MADRLRLNGQVYRVARDRNGALAWQVTTRTSQRGDPGGLAIAEWRVDGGDFNGFERIMPGEESGYLGRDYGENTDGRWLGIDTLGPQINTVTLSTHDATYAASLPGTSTFKPSVNLHLGGPPVAENASDAAVFPGTKYGYVIRGSFPSKVDLSDMTLKRSGEQLNAPATGIVATRSEAGVREISVGMESSPYRVLTNPATPPVPDSWSTNDDSQFIRNFGVAPDRIVGMANQVVYGNVLSGSTTMVSPTWQTVTTLIGERLTVRGFALDGTLWVLGTTDGPYMLDADTGNFFPLIEEIDNDSFNGLLASWFPIGVLIPLRGSLRYQRAGFGQSVGPEEFHLNTSPIQGRASGIAGSVRWLYTVFYNPATTDSWLVAWDVRNPEDQHRLPLTPHVLAKFTGTVSNFLKYVGTVDGFRTNEALIGGYGTNLFWLIAGRQAREIDDANYRYAVAGSTYLTELRRQPGIIKDFEACELESGGATSARTVTLAFSVDGGAYQSLTGTLDYTGGATLNGVINTAGFQRVLLIDNSGVPLSWASGRRVKPRFTYASDSASAAPSVIGTFRLFYRTRPLLLRVYSFTLELEAAEAKTDEELASDLLDAWGSGPLAVTEDPDEQVPYYVRVERVAVSDERRQNPTADGRGETVKVAQIVATEWQTTA